MSIYRSKTAKARAKQRGTRTAKSPKAKPAKKKRGKVSPKISESKKKTVATKKRTGPKVIPKKRPIKKVPKKTTKKPIKKRRRKPISKSELQREVKRLELELNDLREKQQLAVGERKKLKSVQKEIEEKRVIEGARLTNLPVLTPKQTQQSREQAWIEMQGRFWTLMDYAKKSKQLPKSGIARKLVDTRFNIGEEVIVPIHRLVNDGTVEQILYLVKNRIKKISGNFSIWWASLVFTGFGERFIGSKPRILELPGDKHARFFQTEGWDNTGIWNSSQGMLIKLEKLLDDYASSARTIIYLNFVKVMNFDRKVT